MAIETEDCDPDLLRQPEVFSCCCGSPGSSRTGKQGSS
jgi:hypothetical protein